jgi:hypothetical protein
MKCVAEIGSGAITYTPSLRKIGSGIQKCTGAAYINTQTVR